MSVQVAVLRAHCEGAAVMVVGSRGQDARPHAAYMFP